MTLRSFAAQLAQLAGVGVMAAAWGAASCSAGASSADISADAGESADAAGADAARTGATEGDCTGAMAGFGCSTSQEGTTCSSDCTDPCAWCGTLTCTQGVWESGGNAPRDERCQAPSDAGVACAVAEEGDVCSTPNETCLLSGCACTSPCLMRLCEGGRWRIEEVTVDIDSEPCFGDAGDASDGN